MSCLAHNYEMIIRIRLSLLSLRHEPGRQHTGGHVSEGDSPPAALTPLFLLLIPNYCCLPLCLSEVVLYIHIENLLLLLFISPSQLPCSAVFFFLDGRTHTLVHPSVSGREHMKRTSAEGNKLFDWVLIWDCQTSRDDKVHTWEQGGSLPCIL